MRQLITVRCAQCSPSSEEMRVRPELRVLPNVPIMADVDPMWPGLAVHPLHWHDESGRVMHLVRTEAVTGGEAREQMGWVVTHIRSGQVLGAVYERKEQAMVARSLFGDLPGADWTKAAEELQSPVLLVQMAKIVKDCGGVGYGYAAHNHS